MSMTVASPAIPVAPPAASGPQPDTHDEMWDGEYFMPPMPNDEHQALVGSLCAILMDVIGWPGLGLVRPGVNLSDRVEGWLHNYRGPDLVVMLRDTKAVNYDTHWVGAIDFLVEVLSPGDRSREKLPFYSSLGVREVMLIDRYPWALELYRHDGNALKLVGTTTADNAEVVASAVVPLLFRLEEWAGRPRVTVSTTDGQKSWRL